MTKHPHFHDQLRGELVAASRRRCNASSDPLPRRRRMHTRPLAATGLLAAGAVAGVLVASGGSGTPEAFAGWTAIPRDTPTPTSEAAVASCLSALTDAGVGKSPPGAVTGPAAGTWTPLANDTRGPYTLALFQRGDAVAECLAGPAGAWAIRRDPDPPPPAASGQIAVGHSFGEGQVDGAPNTAVEGRAAPDVTGVTLTLSDGTQVQATIANGWFVAWWPSDAAATSAEVSTAGGTATEQLPSHSGSNNVVHQLPAGSGSVRKPAGP